MFGILGAPLPCEETYQAFVEEIDSALAQVRAHVMLFVPTLLPTFAHIAILTCRHNKDTERDDHFREHLLLFVPWRKEPVEPALATWEDDFNFHKAMIEENLAENYCENNNIDWEVVMDDARTELLAGQVTPAEGCNPNYVPTELLDPEHPNTYKLHGDLGMSVAASVSGAKTVTVPHMWSYDEYLRCGRQLNRR